MLKPRAVYNEEHEMFREAVRGSIKAENLRLAVERMTDVEQRRGDSNLPSRCGDQLDILQYVRDGRLGGKILGEELRCFDP